MVVRRFGVRRGVYARHRLDLSPGDIFFGVGSCFLAWRRGRLESEVLGLCSIKDKGLVCYSVRSGWDLWLGAQDFRAGDEILVSAVTHPDMVRIIREHGLRAVPVDIDPRTLAPLPSDARGGPNAAHAGGAGRAPLRRAHGPRYCRQVCEGARSDPRRGLRPGFSGAGAGGGYCGRRLDVQFRHPQDLDRARRRRPADTRP